MVARKRTAFRIFIMSMLLALFMPQLGAAQAQGSTYTSPETGKTVRGAFLRYWLTGGAALRYGNPISGEVQETSDLNGKVYTMQYFERATFEGTYDVVLAPEC